MYETAGSLHGGRRVWMLASIPKEYRAGADDLIKPYVLLTNTHDGSQPRDGRGGRVRAELMGRDELFGQTPRHPIDNNVSEREIKRIVLNRKNSLFVGKERVGRMAAVLSSISNKCRRHAIDTRR